MNRKAPPRNIFATLLIGVTLAATATVAVTAWTAARPPQAESAAEEIEQHAKYLSSEQLTGRGVDTPGIKLAKEYIAAGFTRYGLKPGGDNGSYFQGFNVAVGVTVKEPSTLAFAPDAPLDLSRDWIPLGLSASDKIEAELVFAGYGITAKDYGYDDYAGLDVKGKIVLVLRYEPPPKSADSPFKKSPSYSIHSALRTKANNAREHGALGMILVDMNSPADAEELLSTSTSLWRGGRSLAAAQIKRDVMERRLAARGISLAALKKHIDGGGKPASRTLTGLRAFLQVTLEETLARTENVVAVLPGREPSLSQESIVVGAHYDHLGYGRFGARDGSAVGRIHFGADDNASGTAVLLDVARRLSRLPLKPARSIVFVAFSAEELGLHGSRHFVEQRSNPIRAMINLDMVGRLRGDRVTVFGTRTGSDLSRIVTAAAGQLGLNVSESDDVGRSDHLSFYNKKIPVLHFFTGTHEDYHRASDTWEKLNMEGMARVGDLVTVTALQIADGRESMNFVSLPSRPPGEQPADERHLPTYLGSIPDYGVNAEGVQLAGVMDGSPAALAGLRQGDIIIRLASKTIGSIEDLTAALGAQKPGDEIEIIVLRAGAPLTLKAVLRARAANVSRG
ncbi:MAG TPA: M20/M25/M40 family metallo-hydrolase [Candidatus Binatia bacterium]|nr:M20/M25/M40 family metallo-hydrolase [Candidatus Binatia bacterium]